MKKFKKKFKKFFKVVVFVFTVLKVLVDISDIAKLFGKLFSFLPILNSLLGRGLFLRPITP